MTDQERDVIALNADAIDLMSHGLFRRSLPYLEEALRLANVQLQEDNHDSSWSNPITANPTTGLLDDVDNMVDDEYLSDNIVLEMVSIHINNDSDDENDENTTITRMNWEHDSEFAIYDSACFIHGVADGTNGIPRQFMDRTILAILYNIGLATHLSALNEHSSTTITNSSSATVDHQGLYKALQLYNHVLSVITSLKHKQQEQDITHDEDEDYIMLSLAVLNNITSILFHLSHRQQAQKFVQMLSVRLTLVSNQRHLFLDVFRYCKLNIAVRRSTAIICAPMA